MRALLVTRPAPGQGRTFTLAAGENVLGREPGMAVSLQSAGVSRRHARISHDGTAWWLEDLKSTNGTFVNGDPVVKERLRHLDVIGLGKQAELLFLLRDPEASLPPVETRLGVVACTLTGADGIPHEVPAGEVRVGRSPAANIVVSSDAVSKFHARIERSTDQVLLVDLESINGTLVNGERVKRRPLLDGDVISLAGVEELAVRIEMGEITTRSGRYRAAIPASSFEEAPDQSFSADWKTRFDWDTDELRQLAVIRKSAEGRDRAAKSTARRPADGKPAPAAEGSGSTVRQEPAPRPAAKPAARPPEKPAAPGAAPKAPEKPAAPKPAPARPASPGSLPPSVRPAPASLPPAPGKAAAPPSLPPVPRKAGPIKEVRLTSTDFIHTVTSVGAQDIGRAQDAPLRVNHPTVSRRHARLVVEALAAFVEDLGGTNGTLVNGKVISGRRELQDGDVIGVGDVLLKVTIERS